MNKEHGFEPICDENSRVLILGTLPSVKSSEQGFYYGHPQNRFWRLMAELLNCPAPKSADEKRAMLLDGGIALWDVVKRCDIEGSSDASIRNAEPNDVMRVLREADIRAIYANGGKAAQLYNKLLLPITGREIITLPSTSPANASWNLERLKEAWKVRLYVNSWGRAEIEQVFSGSEREFRLTFYVLQNRILFLKLEKLRIPKQTRFNTLVLLLHPSIKPLDHETSMALRISLNQLR